MSAHRYPDQLSVRLPAGWQRRVERVAETRRAVARVLAARGSCGSPRGGRAPRTPAEGGSEAMNGRTIGAAAAVLFLSVAGAAGQAFDSAVDVTAIALRDQGPFRPGPASDAVGLCEADTVRFAPPERPAEYRRAQQRASASDPAVLDVIVFYTKEVWDQVPQTRAVFNRVNDIYRGSGSYVDFRVVGVYSYTEPWVSSGELSDDLEWFSESDGVRDALAEKGGDLAMLRLPTPHGSAVFTAGIAWTPYTYNSFRSDGGFSAVALDANWYSLPETIAHELGHNLGLHHPPELRQENGDYSGTANLFEPFAQGYRGPGYSTLMGYGAGHQRVIPLLSDNRRYQGDWLGTSRHRAADAVNLSAPLVEDYRRSKEREPDPPPPDDDPPSDDNPPPDTGSGRCTITYEDGTTEHLDCHTTAKGEFYGVAYIHEGVRKWAEIAVRSGDSAVFHCFGPANLEVFAKVLNGCPIDGTVWVYAAGLTDLPIALVVWPAGGGRGEVFNIPDGLVLRPNNGGRLNWCAA